MAIYIGKKIREYRKQKEITQDELATFMNVSKTSVSKWETGKSYPDITSLPKLAGYFNVTIDELLNYESQLTKEEIREYYQYFAKRFLQEDFESVWEDCLRLTEEYYRCFPFVLQMAILLINHLSFHPNPSEQPRYIGKVKSMLQHIHANSQDSELMQQALLLEGMCVLMLGQSEEVFQLLGTTSQPYFPKEPIIANAYQMIGDTEKAKEIYQAVLYQQIVATLNFSSNYLMLDHELPYLLEIIKRNEELIAAYHVEELHPAIVLQCYYSAAIRLFMVNEQDRAYDYLLRVLEFMMRTDLSYLLHGDDYFYLIDQWIETELELGSQMPRTLQTALGTILQDLKSNPLLQQVREKTQFQQLLQKFERYMEELQQ